MFTSYRTGSLAPVLRPAASDGAEDYLHVFEAVPAPLIVVECGTFYIAAVNAAAVRLLGFSKAELRSLTLLDLLGEVERDVAKASKGMLEANSAWSLSRRDGKSLRVAAASGRAVRFEGRDCFLLHGPAAAA